LGAVLVDRGCEQIYASTGTDGDRLTDDN